MTVRHMKLKMAAFFLAVLFALPSCSTGPISSVEVSGLENDGAGGWGTGFVDGRIQIPGAMRLPLWAPDDSRMIYWVDDDGDGEGEAWVSFPDGRGAEPLAGASEPVWSPDGARIAYRVEGGEDVRGLWIWSAEGGPERAVPRDVGRWQWSPDGARIAYWVLSDGVDSSAREAELWIWSVGGDAELVASGSLSGELKWSSNGLGLAFEMKDDGLWIWSAGESGSEDRPGGALRVSVDDLMYWELSPEGGRIAYVVDGNDESVNDSLWVDEFGGGFGVVASIDRVVEQVATGKLEPWSLSWSPDGDWIGYSIENDYYEGDELVEVDDDLWIASIGRSGEGQMVRSVELLLKGVSGWYWDYWNSPPGGRLYYYYNVEKEEGLGANLWVISPQGDDKRLISEMSAGPPSPDGTMIRYLTDDGDLWVASTDGGDDRLLARDVVGYPEWSADGRHLAYMVTDRIIDSYEEDRLWVWTVGDESPELLSPDVSFWLWSPEGGRMAYYEATRGDHSDALGIGADFGDLYIWSGDVNIRGLLARGIDRVIWEWSASDGYITYGTKEGIYVVDVTALVAMTIEATVESGL